MPVKQITLPYAPRQWALSFHETFFRFLSIILHRRAGKTTAILNHHIRAGMDDEWEKRRLRFLRPSLTNAHLEEIIHPPGGRHYGHVMPTRVQAKMVAWDKLKYYAAPLDGKANEAELLYRLPNGNKVQLFGADDPDSMRGFGGSGLSFDEFSQQPSNIFSEVLSKALAERLGYAIFAGTIKGKDHLYKTYKAAQNSPGWFSIWQDIDKSLATESGITIQLLQQAMADDRELIAQGLMTQEEYEQEWYLSLEAAIKGAYYAAQLAKCRKEGRIRTVEYDPDYRVNTAWDLGYTDDSAIWFYQNIGPEIHIIDFYKESGGTIEEVVEDRAEPGSLTKAVLSKGYRYGTHWLPHDAKAKTLASGGKSIVEKMAKYFGFDSLAIVPSLSVQDGVQAARAVLGRCWFDETKCEDGLNALLHYRRKHDNKADAFSIKPVHDWASHPADAFRMLAIAEKRPEEQAPAKPPDVFAAYDMPTLDELFQEHEQRTLERVRI